jgi:phosphoribosylaminoimidazole carboxylase PurE protein
MPTKRAKSRVAILMGSQSDWETMKEAGAALREFGVSFEMTVLSAHRTPKEVADFSRRARGRGYRILIAGAGGAAHLPGMVAAYTELPVIGVPVPIGPMQGEDALLSIVQMPRGVPVATVAIGNAWNAGVLAAQMLGTSSTPLLNRVRAYKEGLRKKVLSTRKKSPK